ncbi:MAG: ARMT1-like domain-containing protein [Candidatus Omnitrophica bacterium]|nr:ARMT1-like domain-containing protein [Candidatus Omnitrophota bacterium]
MLTYKECVPCFIRQIDEAAYLVTKDKAIQEQIIKEARGLIESIDFSMPPPQMAQNIYRMIERKMGRQDPYYQIKKKSNAMALSLYSRLKEKVKKSSDRLLTALEIAISGNIIDYGAKNSLDIEKEIDNLFTKDFSDEDKIVFQYEKFKSDLAETDEILYLADNAGEVVFDRILIEELSKTKKITYVVREKPIINDALIEDALECGIDKIAKVISSGSDAPGTILGECDPQFVDMFNKSNLIISKGQGNYETLSALESHLIYFLFKAKCPVVARNAGVSVGNIVLMSSFCQMRAKA